MDDLREDFEADPSFFPDITDEEEQPLSGDLVALLELGYVEDTFVLGGHEFDMFTPKPEAEIAASAIASKYEGTMAQGKALMAAEVAACLRRVDGHPIYTALERDEPLETYVKYQFRYIVRKWQWPVIEILHNFWKQLQIRQFEALQELQGK